MPELLCFKTESHMGCELFKVKEEFIVLTIRSLGND